jgi:tetratricopeptide (TPR) repeat protein
VIFLLSHFEKDASAVIQEANVHYNSGNLWAERKDNERAAAEYDRAIAMDGSRYEFFHNRGNSLRDLGRFADAAGSYRGAAEILERKAGSSKAAQDARSRFRSQLALERTREGQMLVEAGDLPAARAAYEKAEAIRPDDFEVQLALGKIASRLNDRDAAILHLDRALALKPTSDAARAERAKL